MIRLSLIVAVTVAVSFPGLTASARAQGTRATPAPELRRFALAIGVNDGGNDRVTLKFAGTDATAFARVLKDLGGTRSGDVRVLVDPDVTAIQSAFTDLQVKMSTARAGGARVELLVYYSGHSDEDGLLVGGRALAYDELRRMINGMPADVHIAILDSCASGAFTRTKGGRRRPSFLLDEAHRVHGHAFLSSSSADEQAQESDRLGGSFFTHYFVGGLRGAADSNGDRRVTLSEAYQFAFNETVSKTQKTRYGAQHPAYDMHLVGTGDVILTDLRATSASLVLAKDLAGRVYIRDQAERLILELTKIKGTPVMLGLGPSTYHLVLDDGLGRYAAVVKLVRGKPTTVGWTNFAAASTEATVARGDEPRFEYTPFHADLFDIPGAADHSSHGFSLNLFVGGGGRLQGAELGGIANVRVDSVRGAQVAGIVNVVGGGVDGVQVGGITNIVRGDVDGVQVGGIANIVDGDADGAQVGGIANIVRGNADGVQVAGIANLATGVGRDGFGLQIGGVANMARGHVDGMQIAGFGNMAAGSIDGAQIGVLNIGGAVRGTQIGVVNIARSMRGFQLGVVNVATSSSKGAVPIGLINAAPDGHRAAEAWIADIVPVRVGFKLGSGKVYTLFAAGASPDQLAAGLGLGVHLARPSYWVDIDLSSYVLLDNDDLTADDPDQLVELRAMVGFPLDIGLSVFGGVSANGLFSYGDEEPSDKALITIKRVSSDDFDLRLSPGLFAGISY